MTLNGVIALIFVFLKPNSIALQDDYVTVVGDRPIMSVNYCLEVPVFHFWPKLTHPAARSLCDSWASCPTCCWKPHYHVFIRLDKTPECDERTDSRQNRCDYYSGLHCEQCEGAVKLFNATVVFLHNRTVLYNLRSTLRYLVSHFEKKLSLWCLMLRSYCVSSHFTVPLAGIVNRVIGLEH